MALSCNPKILIADEPTTALDVTIQAQILRLMMNLKEEMGTAIILITHDLGVVAEMAERVAIMYAGKIVEESDVKSIFENPLHPYTKALLSAILVPRVGVKKERIILEGDVPSPMAPPKGCRFSTRCPIVEDICIETDPEFREVSARHYVACHKVD